MVPQHTKLIPPKRLAHIESRNAWAVACAFRVVLYWMGPPPWKPWVKATPLQLVVAPLGALWRLTSSTLAVSQFSGTTRVAVWDQKHPGKEMLSGVWIRTVAAWGQVSVSGWRLEERVPAGKVFLGSTGSPA